MFHRDAQRRRATSLQSGDSGRRSPRDVLDESVRAIRAIDAARSRRLGAGGPGGAAGEAWATGPVHPGRLEVRSEGHASPPRSPTSQDHAQRAKPDRQRVGELTRAVNTTGGEHSFSEGATQGLAPGRPPADEPADLLRRRQARPRRRRLDEPGAAPSSRTGGGRPSELRRRSSDKDGGRHRDRLQTPRA